MYSFVFLCLYMVSFLGFLFCFYAGSLLISFHLFDLFGLDFSFTFLFDFLSFGFFCCVSFISGVVFLYSFFYMKGVADLRRFLTLVFLFVSSMFLLVFSGNFILTMVGWDGLGLVSFGLVIYYTNSSSLESGLITVFSNRLGDVFFLCSFYFFFLSGFLTFDFFSFSDGCLFLFFIFLGSITKSAQVPFSAWLPAAMAAPTPVSSLVHSSTLVTAGVYVLIRFNYLFSFYFFNFFKFFFLFTMLLAGLCACFENDFKKIVAMSTLSQLGMMMFILSVGCWLLSFTHMVIHAFFKSMLFLSTGSLMAQMGGKQDARYYGGAFLNFSSFLYFVVSCLCLSGFPFFLGFYSKDFIISSSSFFSGLYIYNLFIVGCLFTVMYSLRLIHKSYSLAYKSFLCLGSKESLLFFLPVSVLFLKCWLVGGLMYWFFLFDLCFFFTFMDVFIGLFIFLLSCVLFFSFKFPFHFSFLLGAISFLRWKSSSGSSFIFGSMGVYFYETTWMEQLGGKGMYQLLVSLNFFVHIFHKINMGPLIFLLSSMSLSFFLF